MIDFVASAHHPKPNIRLGLHTFIITRTTLSSVGLNTLLTNSCSIEHVLYVGGPSAWLSSNAYASCPIDTHCALSVLSDYTSVAQPSRRGAAHPSPRRCATLADGGFICRVEGTASYDSIAPAVLVVAVPLPRGGVPHEGSSSAKPKSSNDIETTPAAGKWPVSRRSSSATRAAATSRVAFHHRRCGS